MKQIWPVPIQKFMPFQDIEEKKDVALVTNQGAWDAVKDLLRLPVVWQVEVKEATTEYWDSLLDDLKGDIIYAVGGGLPADTAKYLGAKKGLKVICLPTALSVDAFTAWSSGVRVRGCVEYIPTKIVDEMVVDLDVIAKAPPFIRAAAICDLLSIATGRWDWKFAEEKGMNPPEQKTIPYIDKIAESILQGTMDCAEAAGSGNKEGLRQLLDCVILETQMLNQIGHARPEEGSEHYFAYLVENFMGPGNPHANLVCPGILIMATLQGQDITELKTTMQHCHIPLNTIPHDAIRETLKQLPAYSQEHGLAYGIAHALKEKDWIDLSLHEILG
jgi:glycerol-1-phosphate dehydrogenase [NAD(P)+]